MNFVIAMPRLARNAAMMALRLPSCTVVGWHTLAVEHGCTTDRGAQEASWDSSMVGWRW